MKQRFSSVDVKVIAQELSQAIVSLRVSNIYDLSSRIFLFKCAKPGSKAQLLVDSGFRCHLTSFTRTAASTPSQFVSRLRKYLKSRRITGVQQIGTDRVIQITFSDGQYRLYLEFFAGGNIVLTDAESTVLALLRQVSEGDEDVDVKLGGKYVLEAKQNFNGIPAVSQDRIKQTLETQAAKFKSAQEIGGKKAKRSKGSDDIRKALSIGFPEFPPHFLDHVFTKNGLDPGTKLNDALTSTDIIAKVEVAMNDAGEIFRNLGSTSEHKGYIIAKVKASTSEERTDDQTDSVSATRESLLYDDYHPFRPSQFSNDSSVRILEFEGFNKTVDEFYSSLESQKLESRLTEKEEAARKKLESARSEHKKRLQGLQEVQELHIRKAQTIEANTHRVEEAVAAVNGLVGQGMDWVDIGKLIENEQKRGNVVAQTIKLPLKLHENTVTLLLDEPGVADDESDEEADLTDEEPDSDDSSSKPSKPTITEKRLAIDVDLALSPWANSRQYYDQKKTAAEKETKTVAASEKALKSMQKKTETNLKKELKQEKSALRPARKQFWFEKFFYFISSDGYLVLGGKDAQQNEMLYRRYLKKGDIYVHADLHGASSVIIKNNPQTPDAPVPPSTLSQAGSLSVCSSSAWDSKAVMAAWWVNADQVSKTAPTGEYLTTGGFIIRGQKNFLPPSQLLLGFSCYWLISEESRANHGKNRITRTESMLDGEAEALAADAKGLNLEDDDTLETGLKAMIPDVEDAADDGKEEIEEDNDAADEDDSGDESEASDKEDEDSKQRSNPLQSNGHDDTENEDEDEPENEIEIEEANIGDEPQADTLRKPEDTQPHTEDDSEDDSDAATDQDQLPAPSSEITTSTSKPTGKPPQNPPKPKQTQPKHTSNTKAAKRRAAKYALQDEDDKAIALSLLGSTKAEQRKAAEEEARATREAKLEGERARRRAQHEKAAEAEKARQEKLARREQAKTTEGVAVPDDDDNEDNDNAETLALERAELMNIDRLVPTPEPGDELLSIIPVVAPWSALSRAKYKVKLQPGSTKKGKALREVLATWSSLGKFGPKVVDERNLDRERVWGRELELLRGWKLEEVVGVLPVKGVRVVQGGGVAGLSLVGGGGGRGKGAGGAKGGKGGKKGR